MEATYQDRRRSISPRPSPFERTSLGRHPLCLPPGASRFQAEHAAVGAVGQQVKEAVRTLAHVADALAQIGEKALLLDDFRGVELEPHEEAELQGGDEQIALPSGEGVARVEGHA